MIVEADDSIIFGNGDYKKNLNTLWIIQQLVFATEQQFQQFAIDSRVEQTS